MLEASEKTVTAHYYTAKEAATIAEMEKVFGYMGAKGLQGTEDEEPIPQAYIDELQELNRREGAEYIRLEKEEAALRSKTFINSGLNDINDFF